MLDRVSADGSLTGWDAAEGLDAAYPLGAFLTHRLVRGDPARLSSRTPAWSGLPPRRGSSSCEPSARRGTPLQVARRRPPGRRASKRSTQRTAPGRLPHRLAWRRCGACWTTFSGPGAGSPSTPRGWASGPSSESGGGASSGWSCRWTPTASTLSIRRCGEALRSSPAATLPPWPTASAGEAARARRTRRRPACGPTTPRRRRRSRWCGSTQHQHCPRIEPAAVQEARAPPGPARLRGLRLPIDKSARRRSERGKPAHVPGGCTDPGRGTAPRGKSGQGESEVGASGA